MICIWIWILFLISALTLSVLSGCRRPQLIKYGHKKWRMRLPARIVEQEMLQAVGKERHALNTFPVDSHFDSLSIVVVGQKPRGVDVFTLLGPDHDLKPSCTRG